MSYKCFIANNANPPAVHPLNAEYMVVSFCDAVMDARKNFGVTKFIVATCYSDQYAAWSVENFKRAGLHPNYSGIWFVGMNECDLAKINPAKHAGAVLDQMDLILAADPNAECIIGHVSQNAPLYQAGGHFDLLWQTLIVCDPNKYYRPHITGFSQHVYPPVSLAAFAPKLGSWKQTKFPNRSLWLGEIGRSVTNVQMEYAPANIERVCNANHIDGWVWFSQSLLMTDPLQDTDGCNTATGKEFAVL